MKSMLTGEAVLDALDIAGEIVDNDLAFEKMDSEWGEEGYDSIVKPRLDDFKKKYGGSPNILVRDFLSRYIKSRRMDGSYEVSHLQFHTRKINPFVWAAITRLKDANTELAVKKCPQLIVLIGNWEGRYYLETGLCYGHDIEYYDPSVQIVKTDKPVSEGLYALLSNHGQQKPFEFFSGSGPIHISSAADLRNKWNNGVRFRKIIEEEDLGRLGALHYTAWIEDFLTETFDQLWSHFGRISYP